VSRITLDQTNVLVVIPAYNEAETVGSIVREICTLGFTTLVICDGSSDITSEVAHNAGAKTLKLAYNLGVGGALRAGFLFACREGYEAIVQIDADGQHPPRHISDLVEEANRSSSDFIIGSRFLGPSTLMHISRVRRYMMRVLAASASRAANTQITDSTSGFRLIRRPLLDQFSVSFASNYLGDTYEAIVAAGRGNYSISEIPVEIVHRAFGKSSASRLQSVWLVIKVLIVVLLGIHTKIANKPEGEHQ